MAYPPAAPKSDWTDTDVAADGNPGTLDPHTDHHNDLAAAVIDIVAVLGNDPAGDAASVEERLNSLPTAALAPTGGGKGTVKAHGTVTADTVMSLADGNAHTITLGAGSLVLTLAGATPGVECEGRFTVAQDGTGGRTWTLAATGTVTYLPYGSGAPTWPSAASAAVTFAARSLNGVDWEVAGVPEAVAPGAGDMLAANNLSDVASVSTARTNLGLGTAATHAVPASGDAASGEVVKGNDSRLSDSRTPTAHNHSAADITSGTVATARLGSGTADSTKFLRGDQTWQTPTAGAINAADITSGTVATARLGSGAADATKFLRGDQTWASVGVLDSLLARRTSNSANNTGTTQTADSVLTLTIPDVVAFWIVEAELYFDGTEASDAKISWTVPGGHTFNWRVGGASSSYTGGASSVLPLLYGAGDTSAAFGMYDSGNLAVPVKGGLVTTATGGTFALKFANSTGAGPLVLLAGSFLRLVRVS